MPGREMTQEEARDSFLLSCLSIADERSKYTHLSTRGEVE